MILANYSITKYAYQEKVKNHKYCIVLYLENGLFGIAAIAGLYTTVKK